MATSPGRRVSVELVLETARYVRGATEAVGVTRKVSSSVEELGDEADEASADMVQLAASSEVAKRQVDDLGDQALVAAAQLAVLERQLHSTSRAASGADMTPPAVPAVVGGAASAGGGAAGGALNFGQGMRPRSAAIAGVVGAAVALSPMIGAMIAGAVTGAIGVGGIAGGIAMASRDAGVRAAASKFSQDISSEFFSGGGAFVQPTIKSLGILSSAFRDMDLGSAFAKLAPHVTVLAEGLGAMMRNIMPGLNEAFARMGPFIDALADGLAEMGTQLGDFFNRLSRSEGAILGLETVFLLLNGTLQALSVTIEFLSNVYKSSIDFMISATGALEDILSGPLADAIGLINDALTVFRENNIQQIIPINETGTAARRASGNFSAYDTQLKIVTGHQEDLNRALEDSISNMLAQDNANIGLARAMADFGETLKTNGRHWDINTEKGRANRQGLLDSVGAAERKRQADIKMGIQMGLSAEEASNRANTAYNKTIEKLKAMATKAGLTGQALQDLVGDYYINVHIRTTGAFYKPPPGVLEQKGRAAGGPVVAGELYRVNELGMEWFRPNVGGEVIPLSGMQGGAGSSAAYYINVNVAAGADLREAGRQTVAAIQSYERANGAAWRGAA